MGSGDIVSAKVNAFTSMTWLNSAGVGKFLFFGKILMAVAIFLLICVVFYKFVLQYKHKVIVIRKTGGKVVDIITDRAKINKMDSQGKRKLVLWKLRKSCPPPNHTYKYKSGRKDTYILYDDDNGELHPCELADIDADKMSFIKPMPEEMKAWGRLERVNALEKFKKDSWLVKNAPMIVMITACVFAFLIFFFGFQTLGDGLNNLAAQFGQVATSCIR